MLGDRDVNANVAVTKVADLKAKGVRFEHYDMPVLPRSGDIYDGGRYRIAWFKDPDGNILNMVG